jgi:hypothetical protein
MADASPEVRPGTFLERLTKDIKLHARLRRWDSGLYQFLVIGSAIAGFASLTFGLIATKENHFGIWAGAIGALTSVATILSQQLHCVKAVNWHYRMAVQLEVIQAKFLDKYKSAPNDEELAALSEEVSNLKLRMLDVWEKVTSSGPTVWGKTKKSQKGHTE